MKLLMLLLAHFLLGGAVQVRVLGILLGGDAIGLHAGGHVGVGDFYLSG